MSDSETDKDEYDWPNDISELTEGLEEYVVGTGETVEDNIFEELVGYVENLEVTSASQTGHEIASFVSKYKERVKPTEAHKTQTAVNSEGKTNEATKNVKEPLQKEQQKPKNEKQQEQQEKPKAPAKSKGKKVS
mgnify:CR=1 FL=1